MSEATGLNGGSIGSVGFNRKTPNLMKATDGAVFGDFIGLSGLSGAPLIDYSRSGIACVHLPFPTEYLPSTLRDVVCALEQLVQCPTELAVQSVLSVLSCCVGANFDTEQFHNKQRLPVTLAQASVAASGERKTTVDSLASKGLRRVLETPSLDGQQEAQKTLYAKDTTAEGLVEVCGKNPLVSLNNADAGTFLYSYAMKDDHKPQMVAMLCDLWSGEGVSQFRASGNRVALAPRLDMSLMMQDCFVNSFVNDQVFEGQGLLARILLYNPISKQGTRFIDEAIINSTSTHLECVEEFHKKTGQLYQLGLKRFEGEEERGVIGLLPEARSRLIQFYNSLEERSAAGGPLYGNAWAARAPEHATRLGALFAGFDGKQDITHLEIEEGINLAIHFLITYQSMRYWAKANESNLEKDNLYNYLQDRYTPNEVIDCGEIQRNRGMKAEPLSRLIRKLSKAGLVENVCDNRNGNVKTFRLAESAGARL